MTLLFALTVGVAFGCGAYLLRATDLLRVVVGLVLVSNAASLSLMSAGLRRGEPPIALPGSSTGSDPLVQAMTLTALVIGLALVALLLVLVVRIYVARGTIHMPDLREAEEQDEREQAEEAPGAPPPEAQ